jgi:RHS repeat-associated protein
VPALDTRYLNGPAVDQILAEETIDASGDTIDVLYMLTDSQGSVRDVADNDGQVVDHILYDSYGNVRNETDDTVQHTYGYAGYFRDEATGFYGTSTRWYDPLTGSWTGEDAIGFAGGDANLYRYVANSPTDFVDSNGREKEHTSGARQSPEGKHQAGKKRKAAEKAAGEQRSAEATRKSQAKLSEAKARSKQIENLNDQISKNKAKLLQAEGDEFATLACETAELEKARDVLRAQKRGSAATRNVPQKTGKAAAAERAAAQAADRAAIERAAREADKAAIESLEKAAVQELEKGVKEGVKHGAEELIQKGVKGAARKAAGPFSSIPFILYDLKTSPYDESTKCVIGPRPDYALEQFLWPATVPFDFAIPERRPQQAPIEIEVPRDDRDDWDDLSDAVRIVP